MAPTIIDTLVQDHKMLSDFLTGHGEITLLNTADQSFRKILVISSASYFEEKIRTILLTFASKITQGDERIISLIRNRAIERQYHTYFDWKSLSAGPFWGLFGPSMKSAVEKEVKSKPQIQASTNAFLLLGRQRNELVHGNLAASPPIDATVDEIYAQYKQAEAFVNFVEEKLK